MTTIAACGFCGNVAPGRKPGAEPGRPAGPCSRCGHLMFWSAEDNLPTRHAVGRSVDEAVERARRARHGLSPDRAQPSDAYLGSAI